MRPSPAMFVAALALTIAVAGSAIAGADAAKKALTKAKVTKIATKKANAAITQREAQLNVNSAKTAAVAETANTAKSAETAKTAESVNGIGMHEVDYAAAANTAAVTVFEGSGLRLEATCGAGIELEVEATSLKEDASIVSSFVDADFAADSPFPEDVENRGFDNGESLRLEDDPSDNSVYTIAYYAPDGSTVTGTLASDEVQAEGAPPVCELRGHITAS
jgi:hypothetical protein